MAPSSPALEPVSATILRHASWGLRAAPRESPLAGRIERRWRWPVVAALLATIPAFYAELLLPTGSTWAPSAYLVAAVVLACALIAVAWHTPSPRQHLTANPGEWLLIAGLFSAALLPTSQGSGAALSLRLAVALLTLLRMVWALKHLLNRGGLTYLLAMALMVLMGCGLGFWWLEPTVHTLGDGLWLAFTTAATVGYGDLVPTTPASKIFSVFVVLLGLGVLTLVTAAIATSWIETGERRMEREILQDMRHEMARLRHELQALRESLPGSAKKD
ncbi:potassium channel family protein [Ideonella azotifigens]|uniref:Potassium channel domain-containing protein n=1 Tax=Ideonella azotifigens TaxID=513160 RepID=A0ABP3VRT5_9BURK|nr:potassium channel family protein [Ideonella azotifigens]MCD2344530.1 potassium channel family protein [Ideonella azotifigens]